MHKMQQRWQGNALCGEYSASTKETDVEKPRTDQGLSMAC